MEKILCAAIWYVDFDKPIHSPLNTETGVVMCGFRHSHIIGQCLSLLNKKQSEMFDYEQGFLTSANRFVSRKEAFIIAKREGQILDLALTKNETLYSEDLY